MFRNSMFIAYVVLISMSSLPATAADADAAKGRELAARCSRCHGMNGNSTYPLTPKLSGQNTRYLIKALHDFQDGTRKNSDMNRIAEQLTDQDIADLAAWFNSIEITVTAPE